jgi:RNA polymerase sigma factor (sigma-70 family)
MIWVECHQDALYAEVLLRGPRRHRRGPRAWQARIMASNFHSERLASMIDEDLVRGICAGSEEESRQCREELFSRFYPKVAGWAMKWTRSRDEALDLTQEVFLRVQQKLHTFRGNSRFSTWLYTVTRSVAINRGMALRKKGAMSLEHPSLPEPADPRRGADDVAAARQIARKFRQAMDRDLEPIEAQILYLHHVDGMTLPAITSLLGLENKSGAKAFIVSGKRKLKRRFGKWLHLQSAGAEEAVERSQ